MQRIVVMRRKDFITTDITLDVASFHMCLLVLARSLFLSLPRLWPPTFPTRESHYVRRCWSHGGFTCVDESTGCRSGSQHVRECSKYCSKHCPSIVASVRVTGVHHETSSGTAVAASFRQYCQNFRRHISTVFRNFWR